MLRNLSNTVETHDLKLKPSYKGSPPASGYEKLIVSSAKNKNKRRKKRKISINLEQKVKDRNRIIEKSIKKHDYKS